jgi:L-rhamnose mutarotase
MQRMGMMIGIRPEHIAEYKRLHAHCWPEILEGLSRANIRNYSIFLREPENVMFGYWEYHGTDFKADTAAAKSWNSSHPSRGPGGGCSQSDLKGTGGDGLLYCFASN